MEGRYQPNPYRQAQTKCSGGQILPSTFFFISLAGADQHLYNVRCQRHRRAVCKQENCKNHNHPSHLCHLRLFVLPQHSHDGVQHRGRVQELHRLRRLHLLGLSLRDISRHQILHQQNWEGDLLPQEICLHPQPALCHLQLFLADVLFPETTSQLLLFWDRLATCGFVIRHLLHPPLRVGAGGNSTHEAPVAV